MRRALLIAAVGAAFVAVAAGCKGATVGSATPETVVGSVEQPTVPEGPPGDPTAGKQVFESAGCKGCHTLADAGATGTVGPNLDQTKPALALVINRVTNGAGAMPPFKDSLSAQQIADVAAYVVTATGGTLPSGGSTGAATTEAATTQAATTQAETTAPSGNAQAGKAVFDSQGCGSCHTFAAAGSSGTVGPDFDKSLASDAQAAGQALPDYVHQSIVDPNAYVASGFPQGVMPPNFGETLSEQQLNDLVAFILGGLK